VTPQASSSTPPARSDAGGSTTSTPALGKRRQQVTVHDLRAALDDLLAGRPVSNPETEALVSILEPLELFQK
jgi:hypothetical protein